jgi:hypothetical protein
MPVALPRRDRSRQHRTCLGAATALGLSALVGCAGLLDLPSDPQLAEESTPEMMGRAEPASSGEGGSGPTAKPTGDPSTPSSMEIVTPGGRDDSPSGDNDPSSNDGRVGLGSERADAGPFGLDAAAEPALPSGPCATPESVGPDGRCYIAIATALSWDDARQNCNDRGGGWDLATIHDAAVNAFLSELVSTEAWVGASDAEVEGTWAWVDDGVPFWSGNGTTGRVLNDAFVSWNSDEPNGAGNSDCARLVPVRDAMAVRTWADLECFELIGSVCAGPTQ